ncbi:MAG: caspase family protein [Actinomycetota bacterium]
MPRKLIKPAMLIMILLFVWPLTAQQKQTDYKLQKRIALVIGNSNYEKFDSLKNPANDAADVADALRHLGFKVYFGTNQTFREMEALIVDFGAELAQTKGVGLFYYTGHGFNIDNQNFMLPVDTRILREAESVREGVSLNLVLSKMKSAQNGTNFVFLDSVGINQFVQTWRTEKENIIPVGFKEVLPAAGRTVIYSNQPENNAAERSGLNGFFAASFLKQIKEPNRDFAQFMNAVADNLAERTFDQQKPLIIGNIPKNFYFVDELHKPPTREKKSLAEYFDMFKLVRKFDCGDRDVARSVAKEIMENYENDEINADVIAFVKKNQQIIEKEDRKCDRDKRYENSYSAENWGKFFEFSKEIIAHEGENTRALDVMLTLVAVGYNISSKEINNNFNTDTIFYAKKSIEMFEKGVQTYDYGVYDNFKTGFESENAIDWCNYIIGFINYHYLDRRDEGVDYLYKSFKFTNVFKSDWTVYQTIGNYYFDIAMSLYETYKEKRKANIYKDNDQTRAILMLALGYADRAIDAYGRARKIFKEKKITNPDEKVVFDENLNDIYIFRFNFVPKMPTWGMDEYVELLNKKSMPNPTTKVEPIPL